MFKCLLVSLFAIMLGSYGVSNHAAPNTPQPPPESEEYAVYSALLKGMFIGKETKQLVIEKYTAVNDFTNGDPARMLESLSPLTKEAVDDFKVKNESQSELSDKFDLKVAVTFLTRVEIGQMFERRDEKYDGWKAFRQKYPGADAIITLSRVGFNSDKTQAIMFVGYQCDWLCGEGNYILLIKKNGEWKAEKKSMTWIS